MSQSDKTEVTFVTQAERQRARPRAPIVTSADLTPSVLDRLKDQVDRLSSVTRRVKRETQAREDGVFRNPNRAPVKPGDREGIAGERVRGDDEGGFLAPGNGTPLASQVIGPSSSQFRIPGVEYGAINALNSDQYVYYAFYSRLGEQVGNRWAARMHHYIDGLSQNQIAELGKRERLTVVGVTLSAKGELVDAVVLASSGDRSLDQVAVDGLQLAAPFMNPPRGMVDDDGFIHFNYGFTVGFRPPIFGPGDG